MGCDRGCRVSLPSCLPPLCRSKQSTDHYEAARRKVAGFINAPRVEEVVFTRNATEASWLFCRTAGYGRSSQGCAVTIPRLTPAWRLLLQAINIVAHGWGLHNLGPGDQVSNAWSPAVHGSQNGPARRAGCCSNKLLWHAACVLSPHLALVSLPRRS